MKYLWHISCAIFLGYTAGYFLDFSAALIKSVFVIVISLIIYSFVKYRDIRFKKFRIIFLILLCFIYGNIVGNFIKPSATEAKNISADFVIKNKRHTETNAIYYLENSENKVVVYSRSSTFEIGDTVTVDGIFVNTYIMYPKGNDKRSFDLMNLYRKDGYDYLSFSAELQLVHKSEKQNYFSLFKNNFKQKVFDIVNNNTNSNTAAIVPAMIFGYEDTISKDKKDEYAKSGLAHILVLSGYNLSILCIFIFYLFRNCGKNIRIIAALILIALFVALADFGDSFLRAICMTIMSIVAMYLNRGNDAKYFLALFTLLFIIFFPMSALFSASFHLSFIATIAILYVYPLVVENYLLHKNKQKNNIFTESILLSVCVSILVYPYVMYQFGYVNLFSFLFSAVATIFVPFVMLFGSVGIMFGFVSDILSKILLFITNMFLSVIEELSIFGSQERFIFYESINFATLIVVYLAILFVCYFLSFLKWYKTENPKLIANTNRK